MAKVDEITPLDSAFGLMGAYITGTWLHPGWLMALVTVGLWVAFFFWVREQYREHKRKKERRT
jgi:hypothetical protein